MENQPARPLSHFSERILLGLLLIAGTFGAGRASADGQTSSLDRIVPAAAHSPGVNETFFETDLLLGNPGLSSAQVKLYFLPRNTDNSSLSRVIEKTIPAGATVGLPDVLSTEFGESSAAGAILIRSDLPVIVRSRTYNLANLSTGVASWGQSLEGIPREKSLRNGETTHILGLRGQEGYRSNVGFASMSPLASTVTITLYSPEGELLTSKSFELPPYGSSQINDIFAGLGTSVPLTPVRAEVSVVGEGAALAAYGSVVDGATGDPTTIPSLLLADGSKTLVFPSAARGAGASGSFFVTDAVLWNWTEESSVIDLSFRPFGSSDSSATASVTLAPHELRSVDDLVGGGLFRLEAGAGSVTLEASSPVLGLARIYNENALSAGGTLGTAGQEMPALPVLPGRALEPGGMAVLLGIEKSSSYRTNIGFSNFNGVPATLHAEIWTAGGARLGEADVLLGPNQTRQINDPVSSLYSLPALAGGFLNITVDAAPSATQPLVAIYGSTIDNVSGDPTTLFPQILSPLGVECTTIETSGQAPFDVHFSAVLAGAWGSVTGTWDFGDGSPTAASLTPIHTYQAPGTYTAVLSAGDSAGRTSACNQTINAQAGYDVNCGANPRKGTVPLDVNFTASATGGTDPYTYDWNFGDGSTGSGEGTYHTYKTAGIFNVVLTVKATGGAVETCSLTVTVLDCPPPTVDTFGSDNNNFCAGTSAVLYWQVSNANSVSISPGIGVVPAKGTATITPLATTTYTITGVGDCGTVSDNLTVEVRLAPGVTGVSVTPNPVLLGQNATLSLTISNGGSCVLSSSLGNHFVPASFSGNGTYTITYKADTSTGTDTITIVDTNACGATTKTTTEQVN